jgi:hypothetical protein
MSVTHKERQQKTAALAESAEELVNFYDTLAPADLYSVQHVSSPELWLIWQGLMRGLREALEEFRLAE